MRKREPFCFFCKLNSSYKSSLNTDSLLIHQCKASPDVPTKRSKDILQQAKGITLIESTQIRWFSRWSGGGGWSSRAEAQQRPRVSKLRAKELSDSNSSETVVKAARWGASGLSKRATLMTYLFKKGELKSSYLLEWKRAKGSPPEKKHHRSKRKNAYSKLQVLLQKGGVMMMIMMMVWMNEN